MQARRLAPAQKEPVRQSSHTILMAIKSLLMTNNSLFIA